MICTVTATTVRTEQDGWLDGAPPQITPALFAIDRRIYSHAKCGDCKRQGFKITPQHKGREYRVLGVCSHCGARETF